MQDLKAIQEARETLGLLNRKMSDAYQVPRGRILLLRKNVLVT